MKKATNFWPRVLSVALTVCMLFGIVATPCSYLVANADSNTGSAAVTNKVSTPIYTHAMDSQSSRVPEGWLRSGQYAKASEIRSDSTTGRTYYHMERDGTEAATQISWNYLENDAPYQASVLRYSLMLDNTGIDEWVVYAPTFENSKGGNVIPFDIKQDMVYGTVSLEPGKWYDIELIVLGTAWKVYIDGVEAKSGTLKASYSEALSFINMGIGKTGGNTADGLTAGANVSMNIDNLAVYTYAEPTSIQFEKAQYEVAINKTVTPVWNLSPANGYIPSITYSSENELVATVDADTGVVTGVSAGTATIIATPAPSTGLLPITTTVTVTDPSDVGNANEGLVSVPFYINSMDALNTANNLYPTDWAKSSKAQNALGSAIISSNDRTYYQMKRGDGEGNALSWATTNLDTDYEAVVLKYDVMIDNGDLTGWEVHLPAFTDAVRSRAIVLSVSDYELGKTGKTLVPGLWYTFELILDGSAWTLFVDGQKVTEGTLADGKTITCLNMGIASKGGNSHVDKNGNTIYGGDVAFNIDNMAVYTYKAATEFTCQKAAYTVLEGYKITTAWTVAPEKAYLPYVTYTSSDDSVAKVDANGVVTGVAVGSAVITATPAPSSGLAPATVTVTVKNADGAVAVTGVAINESNVKVKVGATTKLTATITPADATITGITWESSDPTVATVDRVTGIVTGVKAGTANITVTTEDGNKTDTVEVTVEDVRATGVTINDGAKTITVVTGKSAPLYAVVTPADAIDQTVRWSSANEAVATVNENTGALVGVSAGTAVITATVLGTQITDTITVIVTPPRTEKCYTAIYENLMDAINNDDTGNALYPVGWTKENKEAAASAIVTAGGRTYWQMKIGESGIATSAYALYTFKDAQSSDLPLTESPVSLKYSVMVDNDGEGWTTYLPCFTNAKRGRLFTFTIANNTLTADKSSMTVENGKWYDIEVVLDGTAWTVYINGGEFAAGTLKEAVTSVAYLNTGIYAKSSAGNNAANRNINIDELSVHAHTECTYNSYKSVAFEQASYRFTTAGTFTPKLQNLPANAVITYASTDENIATVDASGKVTVTGAVGTAMILAYAEGCTLPIATATVKCAGRFTYTENFENGLGNWKVRISCGNKAYQWIETLQKPFGSALNNQAMAVNAISQSGNSMRATCQFADATTLEQATIRYDFMIEGDKGVVYLPGFINGTSKMVGQVMVSYGRLSRMTVDNWSALDYWITPDTWYTLEQVVDTVAGVYDLYINGELILAQEPIADNCVPFNGVYVGMYKICTNVQYIDNIVVTEGIDSVTAISFKQNSYSVAVGPNSVPLEVDLAYTGNAFRSIKFVSSDESVATVDAFGNVTGHKNGTVTITAIPYGNPDLSATATVTVMEKPVTAINAENVNLHVGGHKYLNPGVVPSDAGFRDMLYTSSNPAVATVDEWGEVVAVGKGTAEITITSAKYPSVKKTITVTVAAAQYQSTIYVSVNGGGDGSSANSPMTLEQAMAKVATMDKTQGSIVVELAGGYYKQTKALNFLAEHGGNNDNFVIYRGALGAKVTIGGAEVLDDEIVSGFSKVEGKNYYVMQLNKDINSRHLVVNGVRATRARSKTGLTDPELISSDGLSYQGFSCTDTYLLDIPADDQADLEFSYCVEWANHRGGAESISLGEDGRVQIIMEQPNFQTLVAHSNLSVEELVKPTRPYSMFYENALILLDEPGEWYFDNEEMKLYYMPYAWENINNLEVSYPVIDDWTKDGQTEADSGLINILGEGNTIVQNIKFENITFADTTYGRTNTNLGLSVSQGMHIRDFNSTSADTMPDAAITLGKANSVYFTGCTFTRLGITAINMNMGTQNVQIVGSVFSDISGNGMYIGQTNWRNEEIYNPSDPLMVVKNCDVYNCYMHDMGTEYQSASAIAVGYAAYVNLENNEIFNVSYSPIHIGLGWTAEINNVLRHTTVRDNFIHDFNHGGVWDSGGIYVNGTTSGNLDPFAGTGTNLISGNYLRNMGVGTAALYNDGGSDNWIWEYNVVSLSESPLWHNAFTPNGAQWLTVSTGNAPCLVRNNYTDTAKTRGSFERASGRPYRIAEPYNEESLNDNNFGLVFKNNTVVEDLNWPTEARNLMTKAGLTGSYAALRNNHPERLVTDLPDEDEDMLVLGLGATFNINLRATDGKDAQVSLDGATIAYMSEDESVVKVSNTGLITAVGKGETVIRVYVLMNGLVQIIERPVSVGTDLADIFISIMGSENTLTLATNGDPVTLTPYAVTERGVHVTPDSVKFEIKDTSIAKLSGSNAIKPVKVGETTVKVTVTAMGQTFSKTFKIKVIKPINFELDDLEEIFQRTSISGWKSNKTKITIVQDQELNLVGTGTGYNTFTPTTYLNELFCFEFALHAESAWPSFALRAQDGWTYVSAGTTGYLISFTKTGVQLQRFNGSDRTVLYGNVEGFDSVYGGDIPFYLKNDQMYKIQLGALTNGTNVHLYLSVDGKVIFNCVDKGYGAITAPGHFGIICKQYDTFHLVKAKNLSEYALPEMNLGTGGEDVEGGGAMEGTPPPVDNTPDNNGGTGGSGGTGDSGSSSIPVFPPRPLPVIKDDEVQTANNSWILPVAIAGVCVVAAGTSTWIVLFLKKKRKSAEADAVEAE